MMTQFISLWLWLAAFAPATQDLAFPTLPPDAAAGVGITQACAAPDLVGSARCGVFRVPEDRDAPAGAAGRTVDIAFVILDALEPSERVNDPIILLPGGPGETFTDGAVPLSRRRGEFRRQRDILLVDVRGVGRSGNLSCAVPFPGGPASRFGTLFPLDHAALCRDSLSRRATLDRYTTASSVDDLEDLRRWLGYDGFNLVGGSYGTRVAQIYMRRHPAAVRTVVLNGVAPIAEPVYVQHAFLLQRALDRLLAECGHDSACDTAFPDLDHRLAQLLDRFRDGPVEFERDGARYAFHRGDLAYALRGLLYGRGRDLPAIIDRTAEGPLRPLIDYYIGRTDWVGADDGQAGYHFSVLCAEDIAYTTDEQVARYTHDTFMGDHLIESYRAVCRQWPYAKLPSSHWEPVRSDAPTLLLSGGRDPVTPPEGAAAVARHLSNSIHVVVPNGGHGVGGPCIDGMIARLVTTGSLDGLDTSCVEAAPPTQFRVPGG